VGPNVGAEDLAANRHRATYILEHGMWRAACRACDYSVTDNSRRRAATVFRRHIREMQLMAPPSTTVESGGELLSTTLDPTDPDRSGSEVGSAGVGGRQRTDCPPTVHPDTLTP
jgi:hypothetical protein